MVKSSPEILSHRHLAVYVDVFYCIHFPVDLVFFTQLALREDSFLDFFWRNVSGTFRGAGVLLLDVSVKMEIIDVLLPRIKQILLKIS